MDGKLSLLLISKSLQLAQNLSGELRLSGVDVSVHQVESFADLSAELIREDTVLLFDSEGLDALEQDRVLLHLKAEKIKLPVIILSSEMAADHIVAWIKAGAQDYIHRNDLSRLAPALLALQKRTKGGGSETGEATSHEKNHFLSTLSHELRTPMTVFMGMVELTLNTRLTHEQESYLTIAMSSAEKLLTIIEDLLDFAQMEQGKAVFASAPFDLRSCIHQAVAKSDPRARQKGLELILTLDEGLPATILGDAERLKKALENLIDNAVKFTERGRVSVNVSADPHQDVLRFSVRDTGIGIPEGKQSLIFQSFTQLDSTNVRRFGGMGLGLALARRIAAEMGATLEVSSRVGSGSEFRLLLPWRSPATQWTPESPSQEVSRSRG